MDMEIPPGVIDLPTEVARGWIEKGGGLLADDVNVGRICFMIKTLR
jgi:hypothetical protein